jgi:acyl-CoA reductase-like NAD-dependent aldehyde dehydrogenase
MRAQPRGSHFIDGAYVDDPSGAVIDCVYAASGEVIARLHEATPALIERALASADRAQADWGALRPVERGRVLRRAADLIRARNHELSVLETLNTGKPLQETLVADAASGADALEYFAGFAATVTGQTIPLGGDFVYTLREPLGVCLGIGAWNYPTQIACWKAAPALAFGNAMVFKPSEVTPLGALKLAEILIEAGLREGARLVTGGARLNRPGNYMQPTVFADVTDTMTLAREEVFGPVMAVLPFESEDEVIARANDTEFGLAAGVFTADLARAHRVIGQLRAGTCWINAYNLTPVEAPFGGSRLSGVGRENGHAALEHYTQIKSVYVGTRPVEAPY